VSRPRKQPPERAVPAGIVLDAERLGALTYAVGDLVAVVLRDGREVWLNREGQQTGRAPGGRAVRIWDDVPWGYASVSERVKQQQRAA
jgi:hypothetical protein